MGVFALEIVARHSGEIPEQFNPIAGTNVTLTGTYPDITFAASGGGGTINNYITQSLTAQDGLDGQDGWPGPMGPAGVAAQQGAQALPVWMVWMATAATADMLRRQHQALGFWPLRRRTANF